MIAEPTPIKKIRTGDKILAENGEDVDEVIGVKHDGARFFVWMHTGQIRLFDKDAEVERVVTNPM